MSRGPNARALALAKLKRSGLGERDLKTLGMEPLERAQTRRLNLKNPPDVASLRINYFDAEGRRRGDGFYRIRLLEEVVGDFGEKAEKPLRYLQPPASGVAAYFSRLVKWPQILDNKQLPLIITEGEFKADCACKHNLPCIGLGGVSSWRSARLGQGFLPELAAIDWTHREAYLIFDSDASTKVDVARALSALAGELAFRGALPKLVTLPDLDEEGKTGLDDFLVARSKAELQEIINAAEDDEMARKLWEFNARFSFIVDPGLVLDEAATPIAKYNPRSFKESQFSNVWAMRSEATEEGPKLKRTKVAPTWVDWPQRRQYAKMTYAPGQQRVTKEGLYNTWSGWGIGKRAGDVTLWEKLLDNVFGDEREARRWFERWAAYPIQHPGVKMFTAAAVWGVQTGTGKTLIGRSLMRVYGTNATMISQEQLLAPFNGWAQDKQFVIVDDITNIGIDKREQQDLLKKLITQPEIHINVKFMPTYALPDCINYYFTSNRPDAFLIDDFDRRQFVHEVTHHERLSTKWARAYCEWLGINDDGTYVETPGAAALHHHLSRVDLGDFDPAAPAPETIAKSAMVDAGRNDLGTWIAQLKDNPDSVLLFGQPVPDLVRPRELFMAYSAQAANVGKASATSLGRELSATGFKQVNGRKPVRFDGVLDRYYMIRNVDKWRRASHADVVAYLTKVKERREQSAGTSKRGKKY